MKGEENLPCETILYKFSLKLLILSSIFRQFRLHRTRENVWNKFRKQSRSHLNPLCEGRKRFIKEIIQFKQKGKVFFPNNKIINETKLKVGKKLVKPLLIKRLSFFSKWNLQEEDILRFIDLTKFNKKIHREFLNEPSQKF